MLDRVRASVGRLLCVLGACLGMTVPAWHAAADVAYSHPPDPAGGQYKSAWFSPDGMDNDEYVWDAFTLATDTAITEVHWRGAYTNYLSGAGKAPVYDFRVSIFASTAGVSQPDVTNPPLVRYQTNGNAGETPAGMAGGVQMYDYTFLLPSPFQGAAGVKYWVQIEAYQGLTPTYYWPPDWSIAKGTGGEGSHFHRVGGTGGWFTNRSGDCAFTLMKSGAPTFSISASTLPADAGLLQGEGAYPGGSNATLTATPNAGFGFVNWTENGSQVSTNWRYTFAVTGDRTLVANFVPAYTVTTGSFPLYGGTTTGAGIYNTGSTVQVVATPRLGFVFESWTDWGNPVSTSADYTFTADADCQLVANFVPGPTTVVFDLDSGDPPPIATMTFTPFDNAVNGVNAHFSSPQDFGGWPAFSLQSHATTHYTQFHLSGNYLWPDSVSRNDLQVVFSRPVTSVSLDFATLEMESWADVESPLLLTAYLDSTANPPVGTAQARGTYGATLYPEGVLEFTSAVPFNLITLTVPWNTFGTNNFMSDNFTVVLAPCPADYNGDGFMDGIDYDQFNADFENPDSAQQIRADYNHDGFVDGIDYDLFNADFELGC